MDFLARRTEQERPNHNIHPLVFSRRSENTNMCPVISLDGVSSGQTVVLPLNLSTYYYFTGTMHCEILNRHISETERLMLKRTDI